MRVDCKIHLPHHDSVGNNGSVHHVVPMLQREQVAAAIIRIVDSYQHFKPGMKFNFEIREDQN